MVAVVDAGGFVIVLNILNVVEYFVTKGPLTATTMFCIYIGLIRMRFSERDPNFGLLQ
jgi:hypothetical protein